MGRRGEVRGGNNHYSITPLLVLSKLEPVRSTTALMTRSTLSLSSLGQDGHDKTVNEWTISANCSTLSIHREVKRPWSFWIGSLTLWCDDISDFESETFNACSVVNWYLIKNLSSLFVCKCFNWNNWSNKNKFNWNILFLMFVHQHFILVRKGQGTASYEAHSALSFIVNNITVREQNSLSTVERRQGSLWCLIDLK